MKTVLYSLVLFLFIACNSDDCDQSCANGGIVTIDCTCHCPDGFTGDQCETATCTLTCENGGTVTSDCECDCPDGWTGEQCETCVPKTNLVRQADYWTSAGGVQLVNDIEARLPDKYVLTGVGFNSSSTLLIVGRELYEDGTLGPAASFRDGSQPNAQTAVFYQVPDGTVITGVGFGESQNDYRLVVNYNEIMFDEDCNLFLGPEQLYDNGSSTAMDRWLKISESPYDTRFHAFGGLGIKFSGSQNRQVETEIREIINQL